MALPALTHKGIRPYVSEEFHDFLCEKFSSDEIPKLFNAGIEIRLLGNIGNVFTVSNIRLAYHKNIIGCVDGIVVRVFNQYGLFSWIESKELRQYRIIHISTNKTYFELTDAPPIDLLEIATRTSFPTPQFKVETENIQETKVIAEFFNRNRDMLPDSIRDYIFPGHTNWTYVIGGVLGIFLIGYIAYKVFNHTRPSRPIQG